MSTQTMNRPAAQETARETDGATGMFDGVDLRQLAGRIATPFHAYSASAIHRRIGELQAALSGLDATICFAVKANPNLAILQLMANAGVGADIVSIQVMSADPMAAIELIGKEVLPELRKLAA